MFATPEQAELAARLLAERHATVYAVRLHPAGRYSYVAATHYRPDDCARLVAVYDRRGTRYAPSRLTD